MHSPISDGIVLLVTGELFSRNQMETGYQNVGFYLDLAILSRVFAILLMYKHFSYKKDV